MTGKEKKVLEVKKVVADYLSSQDNTLKMYGAVYGNRIGYDYSDDATLGQLFTAFMYANEKVDGAHLTSKVDTVYKVFWINVCVVEEDVAPDLDTTLERIRNVQRIKDIKLERATKAVERTLREYAESIAEIVKDMTIEDFERVLTACGNEIGAEERDLIIGAYTQLSVTNPYDKLRD